MSNILQILLEEGILRLRFYGMRDTNMASAFEAYFEYVKVSKFSLTMVQCEQRKDSI